MKISVSVSKKPEKSLVKVLILRFWNFEYQSSSHTGDYGCHKLGICLTDYLTGLSFHLIDEFAFPIKECGNVEKNGQKFLNDDLFNSLICFENSEIRNTGNLTKS